MKTIIPAAPGFRVTRPGSTAVDHVIAWEIDTDGASPTVTPLCASGFCDGRGQILQPDDTVCEAE